MDRWHRRELAGPRSTLLPLLGFSVVSLQNEEVFHVEHFVATGVYVQR